MLRLQNMSFNIMVAGRNCVGKSSFLNTLFDQAIIDISEQQKCPSLNLYALDFNCEGLRKNITVIDNPSLSEYSDDAKIQRDIQNYIKTQFDLFLAEESKIRRNPNFEETRVHCLLYFIPPSMHGMNLTDINFLKSVDKLVNIILVIGKADGLESNEIENTKKVIMDQVTEHEISVFEFDKDGYGRPGMGIGNKMPFTVINSETYGAGEGKRGRKYPWGVALTDNFSHCDFSILKETLLSNYMDVLIEKTAMNLYEEYRVKVLAEILPNMNTLKQN